MLFQIVLIAFAAFAIEKSWKQFRARKVSKHWFYVMALFWSVVAIVALTPKTTDVLARIFGVGRGADLLMYSSIVILFYVVHRLMVRQHQLTTEITELVRQAAIENAKIPKRSVTASPDLATTATVTSAQNT
jgi:small membrane protein